MSSKPKFYIKSVPWYHKDMQIQSGGGILQQIEQATLSDPCQFKRMDDLMKQLDKKHKTRRK